MYIAIIIGIISVPSVLFTVKAERTWGKALSDISELSVWSKELKMIQNLITADWCFMPVMNLQVQVISAQLTCDLKDHAVTTNP